MASRFGAAARVLLLMLLWGGGPASRWGIAAGWDPDMAVPPTPTPIKSAWWRRGRAQEGEDDGSSSPGFRAPSSADSDCERVSRGAYADASAQVPAARRGHQVVGGGRGLDARTPSAADRATQAGTVARQLPFTPPQTVAGEYGSDYASLRRPSVAGAAEELRFDRVGARRVEDDRPGYALDSVGRRARETGARRDLPTVVAWRGTGTGTHPAHGRDRFAPGAGGVGAGGGLGASAYRDHLSTSTPLRGANARGVEVGAGGHIERLFDGRQRSGLVSAARGVGVEEHARKGGRVNDFAVSPMSPLAGLPPGCTRAGVCVCVRERERVCVCVCERERESE